MTLYRGYDRTQLDAQYNNRARVPGFQTHLDRWKEASESVRGRLANARLDLAYGKSEAEKLDVFPGQSYAAKRPPVLAFIHGGYWRALDKSDFSFPAPAFVGAGITYASINYGLTPRVALDEIVRQCRAAVAWLYRNPGAHGGDAERIYVAGHSAGGHLAPLLLGHDWAREGLPVGLVKGAVAISGIFDVEPMRLCYLNDGMNLDEAAVRRLSPLHNVPPASRRCGPLALCVGGRESAEFLRQQAEFAAAWGRSQTAARIVDAADRDHFSVMDGLADTGHALFRAARDMALA